jgi:two-component system, NtrC family, response regulator AtoC
MASVTELRPEELRLSVMVPGMSAAISVLQRVISEIAPTDIPVLILGESGTGKEVIASEIHRLSPRCKGPFTKFNCSNMSLGWLLGAPDQDIRDASRGRQAGTVLLDQVTELDLGKQTLLLNLLPDGVRVAPASCLTSRVISTSTKDLGEELRAGHFREELYFRLNGICLRLPSLRQRKEDIPPLFAAFLTKHANLLGRQQPQIKNSTMDLLLQHSWPGNVRELENVARQIVVLGDGELGINDLALNTKVNAPAKTSSSSNGAHTSAPSLKQAAREASRKAERRLILESLERTHWNRKRSALELQISYKALLYKLKQLSLDDGGNSESD